MIMLKICVKFKKKKETLPKFKMLLVNEIVFLYFYINLEFNVINSTCFFLKKKINDTYETFKHV